MTTHAGENGEALRPEDPTELGPYRLVGRLGRGGMGTVYLGTDRAGRRVAVKVINRELAGEAAFRDRFRREVTAARQVRRFCTAPVMDAELDHDPLYVVTEYIEGPSLERAVAERGPLPGSDLEGLAVGVATALAAIHGAGIVHRDLKPANVLLSSTGPRVIDFGIARALDAADGPTRTGQFVGTPNYLPPELLRGEQVTPASDVFSWGCVVAYAGTGSAPFAGNTVPEIFYKVAHEEPKLDGLDADLRDVVAAALDKDPRSRPSVQDLLARLVGNGQTDPATLAETVQAGWHDPGRGGLGNGLPSDPTVQARTGSPGQAGFQQAAFQQPTAMLGADVTRGDQRAAAGRSFPRRPLIIAGAGVAVLAVLAAVGFTVLGSGGPPDKLATVFSDDFSNKDSGWGSYAGENNYQNGRYRILTDSTHASVLEDVPKDEFAPDPMLATVTVSVVQGPDDAAYGLSCRSANDDKDKYVFVVRNDGKGAALRKYNGDKGSKELDAPDSVPGFAKGEPNKVQIACESGDGGKSVRLRLWVNGERVIDAKDDDQPLGNGKAGLRVERGGNPAQQITAEFDDFDLSKILS
ncbi:serine/threonine-protein kinase [Actinomadura syzygii]|uniref:serine/threonine-protein kinase n=1 Tax=Actinomadura syzygii TaxID=1427538 RepID=UPI001CA306A4|nr:serine/threonine-protein kinase [Actinomadura syzygii]